MWAAATVAVFVLGVGACDRDPGEFMLDAYKQNISERLTEVEAGLRQLEQAPSDDVAEAWIAELRQQLVQARAMLDTIDQDVEARGYTPRLELEEMTHELERAVRAGTPEPVVGAGQTR